MDREFEIRRLAMHHAQELFRASGGAYEPDDLIAAAARYERYLREGSEASPEPLRTAA